MYKAVSETFTATPAKVQYVFNMRDISAVVKGLCRALRQYYSSPPAVIRLWVHECERVFCDRLVSHTDIEVFQKMLADVTMKWCDEYGEMDRVLAKPLVYTTFCSVTSDGKDPPYCGISDFEKLTHIVEEKLTEYNQDHASMKLVMFDQAVLHVCRIARIISDPSGNALLVGIGGSGKQSLARLSAFLCGYEILQNAVTPAFDKQAFVDCFKATQIRAGKGHVRILQIITDQQIASLSPGMTEEQVQFILGTPGTKDPFETSSWYYIYTHKEKNYPILTISFNDPADITNWCQVNNVDMTYLSDQAGHFAKRLEADAPAPEARLRLATMWCWGRPPTSTEAKALLEYAGRHGWTNLCRVLFNSNEFVFVN
jgi:hypothetical protein